MSDDDRQSSIHDWSQDGGEGDDGSTTSLNVDQTQIGATPAIIIENTESTSVPTQQESTQHDPPPTQQASTRPLTRTRTTSPMGTIAIDFLIANQISKLNVLNSLDEQSQRVDIHNTSIDELTSHLRTIDRLWDKFDNDHDKLGQSSRRAVLNHPYTTTNVYEQAFGLYNNATQTTHRHIAQLKQLQQQQCAVAQPANAQPAQVITQPRKLPEITITPFMGAYENWPAFRDLFSSMVIVNDQITDVERMYYLRSCIKGNAAQLISSMPMEGDSVRSAWEILTKWFENKRLLVSAHLAKLVSDHSSIKNTAQDLTHVLNSTAESLNALRALGIDPTQWDPLLVYLITQRLARPLIESWENKMGNSTELPTMAQLTDFLWARTKAQERMEASQHSSSNTTQQPTTSRQQSSSSTHTASQSSSTPRCQYPCDVCKQDHYIVACPKFTALTPQARMKRAVAHRPCYNCLGHHNIQSCQSTKLCKTCGKKHHTMLHGASANATQSTPTPSTSSQQSQSSSSQ